MLNRSLGEILSEVSSVYDDFEAESYQHKSLDHWKQFSIWIKFSDSILFKKQSKIKYYDSKWIEFDKDKKHKNFLDEIKSNVLSVGSTEDKYSVWYLETSECFYTFSTAKILIKKFI